MNKLPKHHLSQLDQHCDDLRVLSSKIDDLHDKAQEAIEQALAALAELNSAVDDYNECVDEANNSICSIASELEDYFYDHSERWQESERGQAFGAWAAEWSGFSLDEMDHFELVEELEETEFYALTYLEEARPPTEFEF